MADQVVVVTGASSGIGAAAAEEFARLGWTVALVGRDAGRLAAAVERVRAAGSTDAAGFRCDFAVLAEVRELATELRKAYPRIDVLANNAGGSVATRQVTVDGFESTIQTNHLAPFLLSHELREAVRGGRIINTSSAAHQQGRLDPADLSRPDQPYRSLATYGAAKQANIMFAAECGRRWPDILSTSYHPGVVRTRFGNDSRLVSLFYRLAPGLRTPEKGAETLLWLATADRSEIVQGGYYLDKRLRRPTSRATDPAAAARLWDASLTAVALPTG
jgi:NAD(P)-dependent dehydrogenase (short-subunit alcohol dehydrogenase family)